MTQKLDLTWALNLTKGQKISFYYAEFFSDKKIVKVKQKNTMPNFQNQFVV